MKKRNPIDVALVRNRLQYDPIIGTFTWRVKPCKNVAVGQIAGSTHRDGYTYICIDYKSYAAHRLAWAIYYGIDAEREIDHKNGIKHDNRIENLREASSSENMSNYPRPKSNTSGVKGVCWDRCKNLWVARIRIGNGRRKHIGLFDSLEEAAAAYARASEEYHKEFSRLS